METTPARVIFHYIRARYSGMHVLPRKYCNGTSIYLALMSEPAITKQNVCSSIDWIDRGTKPVPQSPSS